MKRISIQARSQGGKSPVANLDALTDSGNSFIKMAISRVGTVIPIRILITGFNNESWPKKRKGGDGIERKKSVNPILKKQEDEKLLQNALFLSLKEVNSKLF